MSTTTFDISLQAVEVVTWVIGGSAIALSLGRYYIRWRSCGFLADDVAQLIAVILMIAKFGLFTGTIPLSETYENWLVDPDAPPLDFNALQSTSVVDSILLFSSIWAVKFAFTLLYRTICGLSTPLKMMWWGVLLFNVITLVAALMSIVSICGGNPGDLFNQDVCADEKYDSLVQSLFNILFFSVISSDIITMLLPLGALFKLKLRPSHKVAVLFAMSLSSVSIVFEILRNKLMSANALNTLWANLELAAAVFVSTLPAYYSLIGRAYERRFPTNTKFDIVRKLECTCPSRHIVNQHSGSVSPVFPAQELNTPVSRLPKLDSRVFRSAV